MFSPLPKRGDRLLRDHLKVSRYKFPSRKCGRPDSPAAVMSGSAGINAALPPASQYFIDLFWPLKALDLSRRSYFPSSFRDR